MNINQIVDKVYLINLDKRKDRYESSSKELLKNNIKFEKFSAIDGNTIYNDTNMNNGQYGCYLSHFGILQKCIDENINFVAIFEDDVEFCDDFENKFSSLYNLIPNDWDMIYLGYNAIAGITIPTAQKEIVRIKSGFALHGFILNRKAIEIAYQAFLNNKIVADICYGTLQHYLNAYSFSDQLCSQAPGWSDIEEQDVNYRWIFGWGN